MDKPVKIVVTGPESSGKSKLCEQLAAHFNAIWIPEFARIYLEGHGPKYDFQLLLKMEKMHLRHQQEFLKDQPKIVFLDTDLINYLVWEKLVFNKQHKWLREAAEKESGHRYLITYPDLPWEADPLREHPKEGMLIFDHHLREVANRSRPYRVVKGRGDKRLQNAIIITEELINIPLVKS